MSQDPLALSALTAGSPHETEYDAVYAAVTATERGRWFLAEYANRNRQTDTHSVVAAMARIEAAVRGDALPQTQRNLDAIAETIAKIEIAVTAEAKLKPEIAAAADRISDISLGLRERAADAALCDALDATAREIADACKPPLANGHSSQSAAELLRELAGRVDALMEHAPTTAPHGGGDRAPIAAPSASAALLAMSGDDALRPKSVAAEAKDDEKPVDTVATLAASLANAASALDPRGELPDLTLPTLPMPGRSTRPEPPPVEIVAEPAPVETVAAPEPPPIESVARPEPQSNGGPRWHIEGPDFFFGRPEPAPNKAQVQPDDDEEEDDVHGGLLPALQLRAEPINHPVDFPKTAPMRNVAAKPAVQANPSGLPALALSASTGFESPTKISPPPLRVANGGMAAASTRLPSRDPFASLRGLSEEELSALFS